MAALDDFEKSLRSVAAVQRRPQPKLTRAEITAIVDAAKPFFSAYETLINDLRAASPTDGPAWFGYDNEGNEYTGDMKKDVLHEWMETAGLPDGTVLLRATLGEKGDGPRARGPVTFFTYPASTGVVSLWVAKSSDLALLRGMVTATPSGDEEESEEEE